MTTSDWAPRGARVFLLLQLSGMFLLALSTNVFSPLGLTVTIVLGFSLIASAMVMAIVYAWNGGGEERQGSD